MSLLAHKANTKMNFSLLNGTLKRPAAREDIAYKNRPTGYEEYSLVNNYEDWVRKLEATCNNLRISSRSYVLDRTSQNVAASGNPVRQLSPIPTALKQGK